MAVVNSLQDQSPGEILSQGQPRRREDFHVAVICALSIEYDAVALLFDQFWGEDDELYGRAHGDTNTYITGRIGNHNVVLALLPITSTGTGAGAVSIFRSSYSGIKIAFLVGICSGVPSAGQGEMLLGDVVIGKTVIQHDFGKQYPGGFITKDPGDDTISSPTKSIRSLIRIFETELGRKRLRQKASKYLKDIQDTATKEEYRQNYQYPGAAEDKLFAASYRHKHRGLQTYNCSCNEELDGFCNEAGSASCVELHCDEGQLITRIRLELKKSMEQDYGQCPEIFIGCVASGDTVMNSGEERDRIAKQINRNIIAFDIGGAGVWDEMPCIIVKGICDYGDGHRNQRWRPFAAATAASVLKAMLGRYPLADSPLSHPRHPVPESNR